MGAYDKIHGDGFERVFAVIKPVIDEWNPYGLLPGAPDDEFDSESRQITERIFEQYKTISVVALTSIIATIFTVAFGVGEGFDEAYCKPVAEKLRTALDRLQ
jgi:hypothetical protein